MIDHLYTPERLAQLERKEAESEQRTRDILYRLQEMAARGVPIRKRWLPYAFRSNGRLMIAADLGLSE